MLIFYFLIVCLPGLVKNDNARIKSSRFHSVPIVVCPFCNNEYRMNLNEFQKNLSYLEIIQSSQNSNNSSSLTKPARYDFIIKSNQENEKINRNLVQHDNNVQLVLPAAHPPPAIYRALTETYMKYPAE